MSLQLASIHIHPIKSLGGFGMNEALITDRGLQHDRRWMLVDQDGRFLSQRELPAMACLHTEPAEHGFQVRDVRGGDPLDLPWELQEGRRCLVQVWADEVRVLEAEPYTSWFALRLGAPVRLVYMPHASLRPTDPAYAKAITSLSDGFPYLILSQASLNDLNERMAPEDRVPMDRFRPNLVIGGGAAYQEDQWRRVLIGDAGFEVVKPCARCVITTTNQRTGLRGREPLATLAQYRRRAGDPSKVDFGMNAIATSGEQVRVGDAVRVITAVG
ncbi:MAG: MOSC domain-containing protein [Flavobacteriales bacterium]|nr:MOSC domain-containing protein [Flavobacteriales bacterium]MCB9178061.1 MOSC domain-containing protein [Flavobacteriales bacterium]